MRTQKTVVQRVVELCLALTVTGFLTSMPAMAEQPVSPVTTVAEETFWWGDLTALETHYTEVLRDKRIRNDGQSDLEMFQLAIDNVIDNDVVHSEPYLREIEAFTRQWAADHPQSAFAQVLYAKVLVAHGWSYRGTGTVKDVPPQAWADFHRYLQRAADHLREHANVALKDSSAHAVLLRIGRGLEWDQKRLEAILEDGVKRNPDDITLYYQMLYRLLPQWGGDAKTLDTFIRQVAARTRAQYGMGMYARLYADTAAEAYGHRLFQDSRADWAAMKQGYDDMHARYPDNPARRNRYAYMACLAGDKPTLRGLLKELGPKVDASEWGPNPERSLEGCQRLVN